MDTRTSFRQAVQDAQAYNPDSAGRRPAFISSVDRMTKQQRRDVRALPSAPQPIRHGPVSEAGLLMAEGSTSAVEQVRRALEVINRLQPELNAFAHLDSEAALMEQAETLDGEKSSGKIRSPIHGLPVSIKDIIHVKGMPTGSGSKVMEGFMPQEDATVVRLLREAGAIIVGKAHTHEFALGVTTPQSRNPWDTSRDPGGSSGGSAISVATGMSLLSVGTDTRASIRVPASLCGTLGYKPTYGLVSTTSTPNDLRFSTQVLKVRRVSGSAPSRASTARPILNPVTSLNR